MPFELIAEDRPDAGDARFVLDGVDASTDRLDVWETEVPDRRADAMLEAVGSGASMSMESS
jgi:hypothetical protein